MRPLLIIDALRRRRKAARRAPVLAGAVLAPLPGAALLFVMASPALAVPSAVSNAVPPPSRWIDVTPTRHTYGRLTPPQALVATAGPGLFTFTPGDQGAADGPHSVAIGPDGTIWTVGSTGFVVWNPGSASQPRTVPAPAGTVLDLAVAADGTVYSTVIVRGPQRLFAQSPGGVVRWQAPYGADHTSINAPIRFGPDGVLYLQNESTRWIPLTTTGGLALPVSEQLRRAVTGLPVTGGLRLAETSVSAHEVRYVLIGADGAAVRGWRVSSADEIAPYYGAPTLVGGDLVITLSSARTAGGKQVGYDLLTLRITPAGRIVAQIVTNPRAIWGDWGDAPRVGPDGALYQLRTSPSGGVQVWRYALDGRALSASPTSTTSATEPAGAAPTSGMTTATPTPMAQSQAVTAPAAGGGSPTVTSTGWSTTAYVLAALGALTGVAAIGLVSWLLVRPRGSGTDQLTGGRRA